MRTSDQRQTYQELLAVIRGVRRRWRLRLLVRGLAITGAIAVTALLAAGLWVERFGPAPDTALAVRIGVGALVAVVAVLVLLRPLLRRVSDERVALYLEEHEPSLEAAVLSALDGGADAVAANPLLARTLESAVARCHAVEDGRYIEQKQLARVAAGLVAVLVAGALVGFLGPGGGARALLSGATATAENPAAPAIHVTPGDATVSRGADVSIGARVRNLDAGLVELAVRAAGDSAFERLPMAGGADGRFGYLLFDLDSDTEYYVVAGDVRAGPFTLTVAELPWADRLDLELTYPDYTGLPARTLEDGGDVAALRGTRVRVTVTPTLPVDSGAIVVEGQAPIPITADSAGTLSGTFTVDTDGFYHITLAGPAGAPVEASQRYVIDALSDGDPIVSFEEPGRDERVTAVDELFVEARAEDDYGVARLTLHYAVNGGEEQTVSLYGGSGGLKEVSAGHTFYLDELGLQPGDLVSYYATASDNDTRERKRATSDIYFIQIRPFSREFTAAEQRGPPQGGQEQSAADGDLSGMQRQIIAGTFNLVRDRDRYTTAEWRENINTLALAQERLRDQTRTLAQRMVARRVTRDTAFQQIAELLPRAAEEMDAAAEALRAVQPGEALPPEQRALQQLQRAEAIFREVQVRMGQSQGGGGGRSPNAEDLADLFELEMDKLRDQYETVDRGGQTPQDSTPGLDETAERLEELARRQQREVERQRRETLHGRGTAGGDTQRELAEQVEEEARRLERLSRERDRPELQEAARRLRGAAESMRRSAAGGGGGGDEGERARDQLRDARRLLERGREEDLRRRSEQLSQEAERLAREQRDVRGESESLLEAEPGEDRDSRLRRLDARKRQQHERVQELERGLRELAGEAGREQPEVARQLREAAGEISERRLDDKIDFSRQLRRGAAPDRYVRELEEQIQEDMEAVDTRLAELDEAFRERGDEEGAERALEQARDLARGLESMRQRTDELREQQSGNPTGGGGVAPGATRQQRAEARRRLEDAQALRGRLSDQGLDTQALDDVVRGLRALTAEEEYEDPEELGRLQTRLADRAKHLELVLRAGLAGAEELRLFLSGEADVDPEYRALVEEYYRSLSRENDRP